VVVLSLVGTAVYLFWPGRPVEPKLAPVTLIPPRAVPPPSPPPLAASPSIPQASHVDQGEPVPKVIDPLVELKRRLDDPREREARLQRAILNVEQTYGRLFQRLRNLPPDVLDRLKTALAEKLLAMERGSLPDHLPVSDADARAGKEKLDQIQKEADGQIQAVLGDEAYAQYVLFQQSEPYRPSIEQIANTMRSRGIDVNEEKQERILAGYTRALVAAAKISANDTTPESFQALSDQARRELRSKQQARFDEVLASTMSTVLSPAEYKLFMESEFAAGGTSP